MVLIMLLVACCRWHAGGEWCRPERSLCCGRRCRPCSGLKASWQAAVWIPMSWGLLWGCWASSAAGQAQPMPHSWQQLAGKVASIGSVNMDGVVCDGGDISIAVCW